MSLIDQEIYDHSHHNYISRCIHIGLLCAQELATDRPTMAAVIYMLISETALLPLPSKPAFIPKLPEECQHGCSINNVSITDISGR